MALDLHPYRLTRGILAADAPDWEWTAQRSGMGWTYTGRQGPYVVHIRAFAVACGPANDDYATQWRVDDGRSTVDYGTWLMRAGRHEPRANKKG